MPCAASPSLCRVSLASVVIFLAGVVMAALPVTLFAQDKPGAVLPPPSLYDSPPPPTQTEPITTTAPRPEAAPTPAPQAERAPAPQAERTPAPQAEQAPAPQAERAPAPQAERAPTPPPAAPRTAQPSPKRVVRTGCVTFGRASPDALLGCPGAVAKRAPPSAPMQAAAPIPQPVEVQPLPAPQLKQERALEPEAVAAVAAPAPPPAPQPPLVAEPAPVPTTQVHTLSADALFALDKYTLKPSARAALDDLVARLKEVTYQSIKVIGHTDPTGSVALNDRLSRHRAEEVKRYLVEHGVNPDRVTAEGVGSSMPMVIERDCARLPRAQKVACYQPDRRVEIEVTGAVDKLAGQ